MAYSPTLEGFRVMVRRPSLTLAEIAWRWSLGAAGLFLTGALVVEYLDSLPVSPRNLILLDTGNPIFLGRALGNILHGSGLRLALAVVTLMLGLAFAWILVSAIGRGAAIHSLIGDARGGAQHSDSAASEKGNFALGPLAGLNFVRLAAGLAMWIAMLGAVLIPAWWFARGKNPHPGAALPLTLLGVGLITAAWRPISATLSFATVLAVRNRMDTFSSISSAAHFWRERASGFWAISFWFGVARLSLFFVGTSLAFTIMGMAQVIPMPIVLLALAGVTIAYFVLGDWLSVGKLAAWVALIEAPPSASRASFNPTAEPPNPRIIEASEFPPEDDILSETESRMLRKPSEAEF